MVEGGFALTVDGDLGERHGEGDVELAVIKCALFGGVAGDGEEHDAVELHGGGVPVVRIAFDGNGLIDLPAFQFEGAVGDHVGGARPAGVAVGDFAEFFDDMPWHGEPGIVLEHAGQIRRGSLERDLQGKGIERLHTDLGEVCDFASVVLLGIEHGVEHAGVVGTELGGEDALVGVAEVGGGERGAVAPFSLGLQLEGPDGVVVGGPGNGGTGGVGVGMVSGRCDEALEERVEDHVLRLAADDLGIERGGLAAIADEEDAGAVGKLHPRGAVGAHMMEPRDAADEGEECEGTIKPAHEQTGHEARASCNEASTKRPRQCTDGAAQAAMP